MFGISFWKIVVLVAVVAAVWFGFRWLQRLEGERRRREEGKSAPASRIGRAGRSEIEELAACRVCGAFVSPSSNACGRADCPLPR